MNSKQPITLLIVDDHPVVIAGLQTLLQEVEDIQVVGCCYDGRSAKDFLAHTLADIVLLDINLPDVSGIDLCLELRKAYPHLRILALSNYNERSMISGMLENGASGYLLKNATTQELQKAIEDAMANRLFFSEDVSRKMLEMPGKIQMPQLTRREKEILKLIAEGQTSHAIAEALNISLLTVETHRRNIIRKFDAPSMTAVVKTALEHRLI